MELFFGRGLIDTYLTPNLYLGQTEVTRIIQIVNSYGQDNRQIQMATITERST